MTLRLPSPIVTDASGGLVGESVQRDFDALAALFPLAASTTYFRQVPQCRAYRNANTAGLPNAAWTGVPFDLELWDNDTIHDPATNPTRLTCRTPGMYVIAGALEWANAAGGVIRAARLIVSQLFIIDFESTAPVGGAFGTGLSVDSVHRLNAGDYVELEGYQDSGAGLAVLGAGNIGPYVSMTWVGV